MPVEANVFRIFIASSNDLEEERHIIRNAIHEWNEVFAFRNQVYLEPVLYQSHIWYDSTKSAQSIINRELLDECDLMIAIFWKRIGTPTNGSKGGTLEELDRFSKSGRPVLLCFKEGGLTIEDAVEYGSDLKIITDLKKRYASRLTLTYQSLEELKTPIARQISFFAEEFIKKLRVAEATRTYSKKLKHEEPSKYQVSVDIDRLKIQADLNREADFRQLAPSIARLGKGARPIRVLDFGCGDGVTTWDRFHDQSNVQEVIGVDISSKAIELARERCIGDDKFHFLAGDIENMTFDEGFDLIFASHTLRHVQNPQATLHQLWSLLRPGGDIVIRDADAALHLTYPSSSDLNYILNVGTRLRGTSDFFFGRQLYGLMRNMHPSPTDVSIIMHPLILATEDEKTRAAFFHRSYGSLLNYARQLSHEEGEKGPDTEVYHKIDAALKKELDRFRATHNIFSTAVMFVGRATKP